VRWGGLCCAVQCMSFIYCLVFAGCFILLKQTGLSPVCSDVRILVYWYDARLILLFYLYDSVK
jgi:hypothetical protein